MEAPFNQHGKLKNIISEFVQKTRIEQNISQEHLANKLDMEQGSYSKKEKGYSEFTLSQLEIIVFEFNMTLPEFFLKLFSNRQSLKNNIAQYVKALNPEQLDKMHKRLKSEYLKSSNLMMLVLLFIENAG